MELFKIISSNKYDAIVVEGYDGVGKGKILNELSTMLRVTPYRPDYNMWWKYDHRSIDRWKVSGFFWDIFSHFFRNVVGKTLLFDRGVMSGAVYNDDENIARDYKKLLRDMKVFHILVVCDEEDYKNMLKIRFKDIDDDECESMWGEYLEYTERYKKYFEISGVDYVLYQNHYDSKFSERVANVCEGCGHYSYGYCGHPDIMRNVDPNQSRCEYSSDKEVQDRDVTEMQCV